MQKTITTRGALIRLARRWRAWRRRVRGDRAAMALFVLLTIGVFEPLLCVLHCYLWLPLAAQPAMAEHQHHMHMTGAAPMSAAPSAHDAAIGDLGQASEGCSLHFGPLSSAPESPLPQAVHEMMLPLLLLAALFLLVAERFYPSLVDPPPVFVSVPLRPPIAFAA